MYAYAAAGNSVRFFAIPRCVVGPACLLHSKVRRCVMHACAYMLNSGATNALHAGRPSACSGGGAAQMTAISEHLDIGTPLGRIKVVHHTLKIVEILAGYAPHAPNIPMAIGRTVKELGAGGDVRSSMTLFEGAWRAGGGAERVRPCIAAGRKKRVGRVGRGADTSPNSSEPKGVGHTASGYVVAAVAAGAHARC